MLKFVFALLFMVSSPAFAAPNCADDKAIWSKKTDEGKVIFYFSGTGLPATPVRFELWKNADMIWRINADISCSNGVVFCGLSVPLESGETIDAGFTTIYEEAKHAKYVIFDHLKQTTFRTQVYGTDPGVIKLEAASKINQEDNPITLPSVFKFAACQK